MTIEFHAARTTAYSDGLRRSAAIALVLLALATTLLAGPTLVEPTDYVWLPGSMSAVCLAPDTSARATAAPSAP